MANNSKNTVSKITSAKTTMNSYEIDHIKCKLYFGRQFMKKANEYGSDEYHAFLGLRRDFPDYKVEIRENKKSEIRMSMKGLTRAFMEQHILSVAEGGKESKEYEDFKRMYAFSKGQINPYMFLRNWFTKNYPNWDGKEEQRKEAKAKRDAAKGLLFLNEIEEEELRNEVAAEVAAKEVGVTAAEPVTTDVQ